MRARWMRFMEAIETGFWFVPMVMLFGFALLAFALLRLDWTYDPGVKSKFSWAYAGGPEAARSILSTIAGSMITAASVTFSLASVALSIASQQYGSRVLRNFMRDKITQVLLGTFVSTFLYSVLVVRDIRGSDANGGFVPAISVTVAVALTLVSLVLLVYFIHHVSASIQASRIVRVIADDMAAAIPKLYPSETGEPFRTKSGITALEEKYVPVFSRRSGYLQSLDLDGLLEEATRADLVIQLVVKPGDHIIEGDETARVLGRTDLGPDVVHSIEKSFYMGGERTPLQDIRFQFQQLTDVIVRALSPGINDPFTAINGIDELATGVALLIERSRVVEKRQDQDGNLRLILRTAGIGEVLDETVGHIAIYAKGDRFVLHALERVLKVAEHRRMTDEERSVVLRLDRDLRKWMDAAP